MKLKYKFLIIIIVALCIPVVCNAKDDRLSHDYTITGVGIAREGNYLVEVSVLVHKKKEASIEVAEQYALLGCLFKGFVVDRISQKPIISSPLKNKDEENTVYKLIEEEYSSYTSSHHPLQVVKTGKKYRVTAIILVAKDALRQKLESEGILRKLGL